MKKILKVVGMFFLSIVILLLGAGIYLWNFPEGAVELAIRKLKIPVELENLDLNLSADWPPRLGIDFRARRARFTDGKTGSYYEARRLRAFAWIGPKGVAIRRLRVRDLEVVLRENEEPAQETGTLGDLVGQIIDVGPMIEKWKPRWARVKSMTIRSGPDLEPTLDVRGSLRCHGREETCRARAEIKQPMSVRIVATLEKPGDALLRMSSDIRGTQWKAKVGVVFTNPNEARVSLAGRYLRPVRSIPHIDVERCEFQAFRNETRVLHLEECQISGVFRDPRVQTTHFGVGLQGYMNENLTGEIGITPRAPGRQWIDMTGTIYAEFALDERQTLPSIEIGERTAFTLRLREAKMLIALLTEFGVPVFAPFHTFDGSVLLEVPPSRGEGEGFGFPFKLTADLNGERQALALILDGSVGFKGSLADGRIEADLRITSGMIQLPPRDVIQKFPDAMPDSRLQVEVPPDNDPEGSKFEWTLRARTEGPIGLRAEFLSREVPIGFDFDIGSNQELNGEFYVHPVVLSLFRRNAAIENFEVRLPRARSLEFAEIDGTLQVNYPDYTIHIYLAGSPVNPRVFFQSTPPLTQEQIIAVLLFGDVPDELDTGERESVNQASSAVTRQSLTLASMYLFASTPVQSVTFDPESETLSAKFRLGDRTSLNVEGRAQQKTISQVALSRRIGDRWAITTELPLGERISDVRGVRTFLDWFMRY